MTSSIAVGALSLVAAGAIGGGIAIAYSAQSAPQQPVQLHQVAETTTPTVSTTTTATPSPTTVTRTTAKVVKVSPSTTPKRQVARLAPAADPSPTETAPDPVTTTPEPPAATHVVPPPIPGSGPHVCGTTACTTP